MLNTLSHLQVDVVLLLLMLMAIFDAATVFVLKTCDYCSFVFVCCFFITFNISVIILIFNDDNDDVGGASDDVVANVDVDYVVICL